MLVRHVSMDPKLFDHYEKDVFTRFDEIPTWKRTSPHNIQRKTWQAATCNHCHGNRDLFLSTWDLLAYEIAANRPVVVSDIRVPAKVARPGTLTVDTSQVKTDRVVDAKWLRDNQDKQNIVIIAVSRLSRRPDARCGLGQLGSVRQIPGVWILTVFHDSTRREDHCNFEMGCRPGAKKTLMGEEKC